ncbi:MAG: sodium pump decarboxylase subunit gamma [Treponema sp.]|nr:sodium pump decarboxylase subunit gamma [Treponema sp.]
MTLLEMIQQGKVFHLIGMGIIYILMGIMIYAIGSKKPAVKEVFAPVESKAGNAVTAAIAAAINEYRKNN